MPCGLFPTDEIILERLVERVERVGAEEKRLIRGRIEILMRCRF